MTTSPGPEGSRRLARERALGLLYEAMAKGCTVAEVIDALPMAPDAFADHLARGAESRSDELDPIIAAKLKDGWSLNRLATIDRSILRMAAYELADDPDTPVAVVINEAIELARRFSTDEAPRYINGVLSSVAEQLRTTPA